MNQFLSCNRAKKKREKSATTGGTTAAFVVAVSLSPATNQNTNERRWTGTRRLSRRAHGLNFSALSSRLLTFTAFPPPPV